MDATELLEPISELAAAVGTLAKAIDTALQKGTPANPHDLKGVFQSLELVEKLLGGKGASRQPRRLLDETDASDMLCISRRRVLAMLRNNTLPSVKLPDGSVRFDEVALAEWIELHKTTPSKQ